MTSLCALPVLVWFLSGCCFILRDNFQFHSQGVYISAYMNILN